MQGGKRWAEGTQHLFALRLYSACYVTSQCGTAAAAAAVKLLRSCFWRKACSANGASLHYCLDTPNQAQHTPNQAQQFEGQNLGCKEALSIVAAVAARANLKDENVM